MEHERWLKQELMKALSWDDMIVDGVVDVISKAKSADDEHVQDIVQVSLTTAAAAAATMQQQRSWWRQQQQQQQQQARCT
jgi:hypothetical protein